MNVFTAPYPEGGIFHQYLLRGNVRLQRGKLNIPSERLAQGFPAVKVQDIRLHCAVIDIQKVSGLSVEKR